MTLMPIVYSLGVRQIRVRFVDVKWCASVDRKQCPLYRMGAFLVSSYQNYKLL